MKQFITPLRPILRSSMRPVLARSLVRTGPVKSLPVMKHYSINELVINRQFTPSVVQQIRSLHGTSATRATSSTSSTNKKPKESFFSKFKRATTFTISTIAVIGASGLALIVIYLLFAEIVFPSGDTQTFNRAVQLVESDKLSQDLLNISDGERLKLYGETTGDLWTRNRPISSVRRQGKDGKEHVLMRFNVESKSKTGTVQLEAIDYSIWNQEFSYIILDVPGENRHFIVKPKSAPSLIKKDKDAGFLGVKWGPKKD